jgi:hypothetical protein
MQLPSETTKRRTRVSQSGKTRKVRNRAGKDRAKRQRARGRRRNGRGSREERKGRRGEEKGEEKTHAASKMDMCIMAV